MNNGSLKNTGKNKNNILHIVPISKVREVSFGQHCEILLSWLFFQFQIRRCQMVASCFHYINKAISGSDSAAGDGLYLHKHDKCYRVEKCKGNGLYLAPHPRFVEGDTVPETW